jgi:micrococcal nuclease
VTTVRALLVAACVFVVVACGPAPEDSVAGVASVARVIDGDTLIVNLSGRDETVRLLGVDTPETVAPDRPVECYGPEASEALKAMLPAGTEVDIIIDTEPRDRYGRLLGYVFRRDDGVFVNAELLSQGAATTLSYEPNTTFKGRFARLESSARARRVGLWAACGDLSGQ